VVKHFQQNPSLIYGGNESFITLIPKVKDPLTLNDYLPIPLMGCISKTLFAERVKLAIDTAISLEQSTFVKGRNIVDGPLIVNEIISWAKRLNKRLFILKVDFKKAFDNLNWSFLVDMLDQMNFWSK